MILNNLTVNLTAESQIEEFLRSSHFFKFKLIRQLNVICILTIVIAGLIGHFFTVLVYSKKEYRKNSGNIYILCLAIIDSLFLITHIFESTLRIILETFQTLKYLSESKLVQTIKILNIVDQNECACYLVNYLRNVLRLISASVIVAFTLQRLLIVFRPLSKNKFILKKTAWQTVGTIVFVSLVSNLWVPFMFAIHENVICDVSPEWSQVYFTLSKSYVLVSILLPILLIFICNSMVIYKTFITDSKRKQYKYQRTETIETNVSSKIKRRPAQQFEVKAFSKSAKINCSHKKKPQKYKNSIKMTKVLILVSFSYALLNLPHLIVWWLFFNMSYNNQSDFSIKNQLNWIIQITEVFYVLSYAVQFLFYCLSGSLFRNQLKCCIFGKPGFNH